MRTFAKLGLAALVATFALVAAAPAVASDDDDIIRRGSCSGATDWKLKLDHDDGRIEVEFEVDQNRRGERWRVVLRRDGNRVFKGVRTTHGRSGSFEVERKIRNPAGPDRIKARAVNLRSGEVCKGAARI
jgi:2-methylaconitate cis-trans-isomerase PrpF